MAPGGDVRFRGLDGLRGLAALTVFVEHLLVLDPDRARSVDVKVEGLSLPEHVLSYSPLHVLWGGAEAVLVFFVLSGFVLTHAILVRASTWIDYYPRRILRLYLPTTASLVIAFLLARRFRPTAPDSDVGDIYNATTGSGTLRNLVEDSTLWHQSPSSLNGPIWSLHWEIVFSLALPVYLLLTRVRQQVLAGLAALALLVLSGVGMRHGWANLVMLPVFGLGVLAAAHRDALRVVCLRWSLVLVGAGVLLVTAPYCVGGVASQPDPAVAFPVTVLGAAVLVIAFLSGVVGSWSASSPVLQWLGRRSFSLYLTHLPLLLTVAYLLDGPASAWLVAAISVPLCLGAAEVFGRLVEEPAHRASKAGGAWFEQRFSTKPQTRSVGAEGIEPPTTRL